MIPPRKVVFTPTALRDLSQAHAWFTQPGSGKRSKRVAQRIVAAAKALSETAGVHPQDRFMTHSRQLVVGAYVIRYRIMVDTGGEWVSVERIYGPGQDRSS